MQRYFKAEEGRETLADQTAHRAYKKYVGDMIHEHDSRPMSTTIGPSRKSPSTKLAQERWR